jgi:soluble lytic murein transglycosylase-like protein
MILSLLLLLFHVQPQTESLIARSIDRCLSADSIGATEPLLIPYREEIESTAMQYHLPASLLAGVIQEESRFEPWATRAEPRYLRNRKVRRFAVRWSKSHGGLPNTYTEQSDRSRSYGLMQVMGETAREQGFAAPYLAALYLPRNAIEHGAMLLKHLMARYRNDTLSAISAYNQGSARRRRGVFLNARYVYRVTLAWRAYDALFNQGG